MASSDSDSYSHDSAEPPRAGAESPRDTTTPPPQPTQIEGTKQFSTPVSVKSSSISTRPARFTQNYRGLNAEEMDSRAAEISVETFLHEFTHHIEIPDTERAAWLSTAPLANLDSKEKEVNTYAPLLNFLSSPLNASPDLTILDNGDWSAKGEGDRRRFDLGIYPRNGSTALKIGKTDTEEDRHPNAHRINWDTVVVPIEVKWGENQNAFGPGNSPKDFLAVTLIGKRNRGQITEYAAKIMARQHRTCLFSVFIYRFTARLLRWDRVGVVVSEPIHYKEDPAPLITFLYRLGQMHPEDRGIDPTVMGPTQEEKDQLDNFEPDNESYRQHRNNTMPKGCPIETIFKVEVADTTLPTAKRRLLISKAKNASESVTGRGTKGFVAYDLEDDRLVWFKDCWRVDSNGSTVPVHPEHETYARLRQHDVTFVATAVCGGDVESPRQPNTPPSQGPLPLQENRLQTTLNQRWVTDFRPKIHYRLVVEEIGRKLETYADSQELCFFIGCALTAHREAWTKAEVLHRDISPGNILIDDRNAAHPKAFLNDWDLCKYKEDLKKGPSDKARSGTWQFLSAMLLKYPKKRYELADDLESFVHLLAWFALRFHKHSASPTPGMEHNLHQLVMIYETHGIDQDGYDRGGDLKYQAMCNGFLGFTLDPKTCPTFGKVLEDLMGICKEHYAAVRAKNPCFMRDSEDESIQPQQRTGRVSSADIKSVSRGIIPPTEKQQVTSTPKAQCKLETHSHIFNAIWKRIEHSEATPWYLDKGEDQFPFLPVCTTKTHRQSGTTSSAEKRKTSGSSGRNAKRVKAMNESQLESITESL